MSFENLSLSTFTEAVKLNLQKQNIETNIQKNILDNISVYFNNANGVDNDMTTLNEEEYNKANADIETKIAELKKQTQTMGNKKPLGLGGGEKILSYSDKMCEYLKEYKYASHRKFPDNIGQITKNNETVIIEKNNDGSYTIRRIPEKEKGKRKFDKLEVSNYNSLDELKLALDNDEFGWGRTSKNGKLSMYDFEYIE